MAAEVPLAIAAVDFFAEPPVDESSVSYVAVLRALPNKVARSKNESNLIIPMRVLIAEDDPALATFVQKGLEAEHYAVDVTHDGEQAKAMASELDYDLFMLDLNLPRIDGISILRHLRPRKPSMPILILTSRNRWKTGCNALISALMITWESLSRL